MTVLIAIILVALIFDFLNGFHDAANSIATVVSTRVLSPQQAVVWAAFFNFVAAFVLGTHVAKTIGKGMIDISVVTQEVILAGLLGAIFWNLFTWYYGIPVSSSHALVGGYAGAAIAKARPRRDPLGRLDEDAHLHRPRPDDRPHPRLPAHGRRELDLPPRAAAQGRPLLPPRAARLGGALQPRPRRQRRPEDDGHHHRPAGRLGRARRSSRSRSG